MSPGGLPVLNTTLQVLRVIRLGPACLLAVGALNVIRLLTSSYLIHFGRLLRVLLPPLLQEHPPRLPLRSNLEALLLLLLLLFSTLCLPCQLPLCNLLLPLASPPYRSTSVLQAIVFILAFRALGLQPVLALLVQTLSCMRTPRSITSPWFHGGSSVISREMSFSAPGHTARNHMAATSNALLVAFPVSISLAILPKCDLNQNLRPPLLLPLQRLSSLIPLLGNLRSMMLLPRLLTNLPKSRRRVSMSPQLRSRSAGSSSTGPSSSRF